MPSVINVENDADVKARRIGGPGLLNTALSFIVGSVRHGHG